MNKLFYRSILFFWIICINYTYGQTLTSITTSPVTLTSSCIPINFNVSFTTTGVANPGNNFYAELSDTSGSFVYIGAPIYISNILGTTSGTIPCSLTGAITGKHYRIRVVSTNPVIKGSNNGSDLLLVGKIETTQFIYSNEGFDSYPHEINLSILPGYNLPCVWTVSNATIDSGQASRSVWYHYKSVTSPTPTTLTWQAFSNGCYGIVRSSNTLIYPPITAIHLDTFNTISSCNPSDKPMIFTLDGRVGPTNKFTIQLSDTNGSFLHTSECQRFSSGTWNYIQYTLYSWIKPEFTSSHYRIRIISSDPPLVSNDNGTDLFIVKGIPDTLSDINVCNNGPVNLSVLPTGGTFDIANPDTGSVSKRYTYTYTDSYGCSELKTGMIIRSVPPSQMGPITTIGGNAKVCPNQTKNYEVDSVPGTTYNWIVPTGATIVSGQGSSNLKVKYTTGFTQSGNLKVTISNFCGIQTYTLLIERNDPPQPSVISGLTYGVCSLTNVRYAITAVPGFSYLWSTNSADAIIASGQNSRIAYLNFNPAFVSGTISIALKNNCGVSIPSVLAVNALPLPPTSISGPTTVCANQSGVNYSIPAVNNILNYTWIGPTGSKISDGVTTSTTNTFTTVSQNVSIKFASSGGTIRARANNACASSFYRSFSINITCRDADDLINSADSVLSVYPNPANDVIKVSFKSKDNEKYTVSIANLLGESIITNQAISKTDNNNLFFNLDNVPAGIYIISILSDQYLISKKIIITH